MKLKVSGVSKGCVKRVCERSSIKGCIRECLFDIYHLGGTPHILDYWGQRSHSTTICSPDDPCTDLCQERGGVRGGKKAQLVRSI